MPAIDTNVLIRNIIQDNREQAETARQFLGSLTSNQPGFICREVALELVWVLEKPYRFPRVQIADILLDLTATTSIVVEDRNEVAIAALHYRESNEDFSDLLILAAARRSDATPLYTFDQKLARLEGATLLPTPTSP